MLIQGYTLDELVHVLRQRVPLGSHERILTRRFLDGSSLSVLLKGKFLVASWRGHLVNPPVLDGLAGCGPSRYHSLCFYEDEPHNS